jgi:hypothetical protein
MAWLEVIGPAFLLIVLLMVPGLALGLALRLPLLQTLAFAPVGSVAIVSVLGIVGPAVRIPWRFWASVVVLAVLSVLLIAIWRYRLRRIPKPQRAPDAAKTRGLLIGLGLGVLTGAVFCTVMYARPLDSPSQFGQLYDIVFHFNMVRYFIDTANGSTLHAGLMDGSMNASGFYPAAWHDFVSLAVMGTGASIPVVTSAINLVLVGVIWPLGVAMLAGVLFGQTPRMLGIAASVAGMAGTFPWRFLSWGILVSNTLGLALLPGAAAVVIWGIRKLSTEKPAPRGAYGRLALVVVVSVIGLAIAQPNTLFTAMVLFLPLVYWALLHLVRARRLWVWVVGIAFPIVVVLGALVIYHLPFMARTVNWKWPATADFWWSIEPAFLNGTNGAPIALLTGVLTFVGVVQVFQLKRNRWLLASLVLSVWLYCLAVGTDGPLKAVATGFWYHDSFRLAAIIGIPSILLAVVGLDRLCELAGGLVPKFRGARSLMTTGVVVVVLLVSYASPALLFQRQELQKVYSATWMLSADEIHFLSRVAEKVPSGTTVLNNPYDGSSLGYAFNNVNVLFRDMPGNWMGDWNTDYREVLKLADDFEGNQQALCPLLKKHNVQYVLQLEPEMILPDGDKAPWVNVARGIRGSGLQLVMKSGAKSLWRITACGA